MAATVKNITFASRQAGIPACDAVIIHFTFGPVTCHYVPSSETHVDVGWRYSFYVQEEDLAGGMTMTDFAGCNVVAAPALQWECDQTPEVAADPEECPARELKCFVGVDILEDIESGLYLGLLRYDEVCETFCLEAYPVADFLPEATPDIDALDYEVFSAPEELQTGMETYVTHMPRPFTAISGIRVSSAHQGDGDLIVNFTVNGVDLTVAPVTLTGGTTVVIPVGSLTPAFQGGAPIAAGAEVLAEVISVAYDQYGNNWAGLRLAFLGRFTS